MERRGADDGGGGDQTRAPYVLGIALQGNSSNLTEEVVMTCPGGTC